MPLSIEFLQSFFIFLNFFVRIEIVFVIEMIMRDDVGNINTEVLSCDSVEEFQTAKKMFENKELTLKLYECKEINGEV